MNKKILAIDTSCDDTSIAVVEKSSAGKIKMLSNIVSSQVKLHQPYGGVYPFLAKREHQKNLPIVLKKALKQAGLGVKPKLEAIAVTNGPGLEPCLWTGINFAQELAEKWNLSVIPVNHIEAHILVNFAEQGPALPALALVVSGGHTQLVLVRAVGKYKIIGETRDDAAGECFDKTARMLGLPYPGGPAIAQQAEQWKSGPEIILPRPMLYSKDYDFSFSGLKTAVLYDYKKRSARVRRSKQYIRAMAKEIQQAIIDVLIKKTLRAVQEYKVKTIILGGGVAANSELRKQFKHKGAKLLELKELSSFIMPAKKFCTDNAAMIGITAFYHLRDKQPHNKIEAKANLRIS